MIFLQILIPSKNLFKINDFLDFSNLIIKLIIKILNC